MCSGLARAHGAGKQLRTRFLLGARHPVRNRERYPERRGSAPAFEKFTICKK